MGNVTYHTGEHKGFSWEPCVRCGSPLGGDRWEWFLLKQRRTHGVEPLYQGAICIDCFDEINHNN